MNYSRTKTRLGQLTEDDLYTGGSIAFGYKRVDNGRKNKRDKPVFDLAVNEDEAEIVRLIFHKYVDEGFGALRISRFLAEQNIMGREGKNIPRTSIVRMIITPATIQSYFTTKHWCCRSNKCHVLRLPPMGDQSGLKFAYYLGDD